MTRKQSAANARRVRSETPMWKIERGPKFKRGDTRRLASALVWSENRLRHYFTGSTLANRETKNLIMFAGVLGGFNLIARKVK